MNINKQNAAQWVNRFLEGETSNAEEQELYRFFREDDVPSELKKYIPMFNWYADGMKEPLPQHCRGIRMKHIFIRMSIAAAILLVCGFGIKFYQYYQQDDKYECYEGSYIIRNGKKITDMKVIMPEVQKTSRYAELQERKVKERIKSVSSDNPGEGNNVKGEGPQNLPLI